jgi:hypothetical protein
MLRFIVPESVKHALNGCDTVFVENRGKGFSKGFPSKKKTVLRGAVRGGRCTATGSKKVDQ